MKNTLVLHRLYLEKATHGILCFNDQLICLTLELPWVGNQAQISCIPEGCYSLAKRYSDRFKEHIEVLDVPNRSLILFHPANHAQRELKGCIAPISQFLATGWGSQSRVAFEKLKNVVFPLLEKGKVELIVKSADEKILRYIKNQEHEKDCQ